MISFYCQYLKKLLININTFRFAEAFVSGDRDDRKYPDDSGPTAMIDRGFMILNLCNYILQSQQIFNKMGRYYSEHN